MKTLLWILLAIYLLGIFAIVLVDAFDNAENGKLKWFSGRHKKGYWKRCIISCLGSWVTFYKAAKGQISK